MQRAGLDEVRRLIREADPPRPSQRVGRAFSADLDWIVMRCLEKDRQRRYDTANALALDLQRHLADEAVSARPPTARYLLGRLIRRNRVVFAAGAAVALAICAGLAVSLWQGMRAQREAARAKAALTALRATAPAFADQARGLVAEGRFDAALEKLAHAVQLRPDCAEYLVLRGDFLQSQLRLAEAAAAYRAALQLDPAQRHARTSAAVTESVLAAPRAPDGKLSRKSLAKLHALMQQQQRTAAEQLPVVRLLGEEDALLVAAWLPRLQTVPLPAGDSLEKRLTVRTDAGLSFNLHNTRIVDLSPLAAMPLRRLDLGECDYITDFSPLEKLRALEWLDLSDTKIRDLSPLRGLPLKTLGLKGAKLSDLSPLAGMKLEKLNLRTAKVSDISPLIGMPLTSIDLSSTGVEDFSPLAGMPLEACVLGDTKVSDLAFLRGAPVRRLIVESCRRARHFAVLMELPQLETLELPDVFHELPEAELAAIGALRGHPTLREIVCETVPLPASAQSAAAFCQQWDREMALVLPLRRAGLEATLRRIEGGALRLTIKGPQLRDLSLLKNAPIAELELRGCEVSDLSPIVALPLTALHLEKIPVADLSPLRGMPLRHLSLHQCKSATDLAPLAGLEALETLVLPSKATAFDFLRKHPRLQRLSFEWDKSAGQPKQTAAEFWAEHDAKKP